MDSTVIEQDLTLYLTLAANQTQRTKKSLRTQLQVFYWNHIATGATDQIGFLFGLLNIQCITPYALRIILLG